MLCKGSFGFRSIVLRFFKYSHVWSSETEYGNSKKSHCYVFTEIFPPPFDFDSEDRLMYGNIYDM